MKPTALVKSIHNWMGLLLGVQVLLWMASGAVMSLFDIDLVRGETNALQSYAPELDALSYANPGGVIAQTPDATAVTLKFTMGRPVYAVAGRSGEMLFDAQTAKPLPSLKEAGARAIARKDFVGAGEIVAAELLDPAPRECGCDAPVWRIAFDDRLQTRIYVSPRSGAIEARRNSVWRLYDFFWMLHIMDYGERKDFNNPLLQAASVTGFLFAVSGFWLVVVRLARGRYAIRRKPKNPAGE